MVGSRRIGGVAVALLLVAGGTAIVRGGGHDEDPVSASSLREHGIGRGAEHGPHPVVIAGVEPDARPAAGKATAALQQFDDCGTLLSATRAAAAAVVTPYGLPFQGGGSMPGAMMPAAAQPTGGGSAGSGSSASAGSAARSDAVASPAFSTTNVQERGVDEPDIVKNDGRHAFAVFSDHLRAIRLDHGGRGVVEVDDVDLDMAGEVELLEVGDRIVAMSSHEQFMTRIVVVDVSDPGDLRETFRIDVEGAYLSARKIGDTVRLVVTQNGPAFDFTYPQSEDVADVAGALAHNRAVIGRAQLAEWLPDVTFDGGPRLVPAPACGDTYLTSSFAGAGSTTVVTLSPSEGAVLDATAVLATAQEVYASADHLYVATSSWTEHASLTTEIHRFDVSDPRRSVYEASGSVAGELIRPPWFVGADNLGQWAMSDHEGDLRVATTLLDGGGTNGVTVLRRAHDRLVPVGAVTGFGVGEQIYGVRFMGSRGYVVTYRKTDPLVVLDLSDPTAPRVMGELKVPGYSAYLHPIRDGLLLGIGQADDNEDGLADGTKVSLFDVSDPAHPREVRTLQLGERGSLAGVERDPRTFTWWPDPARAVLTMTNFEDQTRFQGAIAIDVASGRLAEVGRVEHRIHGSDCAESIVRTRVIGDSLLSFSPVGVDVHALDDLAPRDSLRFDGAITGPCQRPYQEQPQPQPPSSTTSTTTLLP